MKFWQRHSTAAKLRHGTTWNSESFQTRNMNNPSIPFANRSLTLEGTACPIAYSAPAENAKGADWYNASYGTHPRYIGTDFMIRSNNSPLPELELHSLQFYKNINFVYKNVRLKTPKPLEGTKNSKNIPETEERRRTFVFYFGYCTKSWK